jgi:predicted dehydrogenase
MTRPVGVGVIGCGYWGPNLVRNFAWTPGASVVAVCDAQVERAQNLASRYAVPTVYTDAAELIADPDVDLVVVATPARTHYPLARAAIEAGRHVLVMKPMTTNVEDAEDLLERANASGVLLAVDHTFVYTPAVRQLREMVASGDLGDIYYIDSVRINLGVFQSDVNVIWDLGPHDISIIDYIMGGQEPTEVSAIGAAHAGSLRENVAYVTMRFGPNVLAHVHVNWLAPAKIRRTIVGGSKQMVVYDDMLPSEKLHVYDRGVTISPWDDREQVYEQLVSYRTGEMRAPRLGNAEALAVEAEELIACITGGGSPVADARAGLRAVRILAAAEQSMRHGSHPVVLSSGRALTPVPMEAPTRIGVEPFGVDRATG